MVKYSASIKTLRTNQCNMKSLLFFRRNCFPALGGRGGRVFLGI